MPAPAPLCENPSCPTWPRPHDHDKPAPPQERSHTHSFAVDAECKCGVSISGLVRSQRAEIKALKAHTEDLKREYDETCEKAHNSRERADKAEAACDPHPASSRTDDLFEPPWKVIGRLRAERDEAIRRLAEVKVLDHINMAFVPARDLQAAEIRAERLREALAAIFTEQDSAMDGYHCQECGIDQSEAWEKARALLGEGK
jgi:hypothetical protein